MTFPVLSASNPSGSYSLSRSVRLRSSATAYLNRTFGTATSQSIFTFSAWVKRGKLGATQTLFGCSTSQFDGILFNTSDQLVVYSNGGVGLTTSAVYRDPSAWYHLVYLHNGTSNTIYINGVSVGTGTFSETILNTANSHIIGQNSSSNYFDGYLTEINFIDGQALTPSSFGAYNSTTGVWQPIKYTGTYGTNGFYLNFNNNASTTTLGYDASGNGNNWTTNNISVTAGSTYDSMTDVPTLTSATAANYCVANPLKKGGSATITDANLTVAISASGGEQPASFAASSGKWYWEASPTTAYAAYGIILTSATPSASSIVNGYHYYGNNGQFYTASSGVSYGATFGNGDVIGVALDMDNNQITFYKNGTSQGVKSISAGEYNPDFGAAAAVTSYINFGQRPFSYTPPTGFVALNTYNLPTPTIVNGASYMAATTYTGNGGTQNILNSANTTTGVSFKPDLVWVKARSTTYDNQLTDSVRGANYELQSNSTGAQTNYGLISAFNSNGFTVYTNGTYLASNANGTTYVGWQWQAGAGSSSSNTNGSITSTVSVNATAGFSVVTYTGTGSAATVGHGLGVAPSMIIARSRTNSGYNWGVYHSSLQALGYGSNAVLELNNTGAYTTSYNMFNPSNFTSNVIGLGTEATTNGSGSNYVAYCWAQVAGFSKAFSYTGNGSTDGSFVYLGFRPRMVLIKRTDSTGNWYIWDTSRNTYNVVGEELYPNLSNAGSTNTDLDLLSNGFKMRSTAADFNANGGSYIGFAWAENPFKQSLAR